MAENNKISFDAIKQGVFAFLYHSPDKKEEYRWDAELCSASRGCLHNPPKRCTRLR